MAKKDVVLGISNQKVFVRLVDVPWMPSGELKASLKFQVADLVPMPIEEAVLDFVPLDEIVTDSARNLLLNQRVSTVSPFISPDVWKSCSARALPFDGPVFAGLDQAAREGRS